MWRRRSRTMVIILFVVVSQCDGCVTLNIEVNESKVWPPHRVYEHNVIYNRLEKS